MSAEISYFLLTSAMVMGRQYAVMSGLSEFGTTYLLSGISKFGGKLTGSAAKAASERVTNGALRFALDTGIKMGGEGVEEVLQNELDLFFRNMVLGENNDLNPLTEENAYTFLMAAATAGLLEGPGSACLKVRFSCRPPIICGAKMVPGLTKSSYKEIRQDK